MFRIVISLICFVTVPVMLFLAWNGWAKGVRAELPPWRNGLCILALLLLLLNWLGTAVLEAPVFVNPRTPRPADLMQVMLTLSHPLAIVALVFAFAFRRVSRVQTVVAALLMLVSWPIGYV